ncbi:hypothetical protein FI667_g7297, partial [Globisporangium splendens]
MQSSSSRWLETTGAYAASSSSSGAVHDDGLRTPKLLASHHSRAVSLVHQQSYESSSLHADAKYSPYYQNHYDPVHEIPLRRAVHDLPRPQHHGAPHLDHRHHLPPLTISSISPPNSTRPVLGLLAPLRSLPRTKSPEHQQYQQGQQLHNQFRPAPVATAPRPTLPPVRAEYSIAHLLTPTEGPSHLSPFAHSHGVRSPPVLPALRSALDGCVLTSPIPSSSSNIPSPASSTSSYSSSYGHENTVPSVTPRGNSTSSSKPSQKCRRDNCSNAARRKGLCMDHGGRHFCKMDGCQKCAHRGGFCISHGGGRRCAIANCAKSAQSGGICYSHGGGKRCATDGCTHAARSGGFCIKHGKQQQQQHPY